jgi:hypothetical protein
MVSMHLFIEIGQFSEKYYEIDFFDEVCRDQLLKMNEKISGVILAGGAGKRLGGVTKSRLQFTGRYHTC